MKPTDGQLREELKTMVDESEKEAVSTAPIVSEIPTTADIAKWVVRKLPRSIQGLTVAFVTLAGVIILIVVTEDALEQAYDHHKPLVKDTAVNLAEVANSTAIKLAALEASIQKEVVSDDFWHFPYTPSRREIPHYPSPFDLALPAGTSSSNTASYPVQHFMFSRNVAGVTGGYIINTDELGVIKAVPQRPIV